MAKNDFKDVEYVAIIDGDKTLMLLKESDLKNKSKLEVQELIGEKLGPGRFAMNMKLKTESQIRTTRIRAITKEVHKDNLKGNPIVTEEIKKLNEKIESISNKSNEIGIDYLLDITKQSYILQIEILKNQITDMKEKIESLEKENDQLVKELDKAESNNNSNVLISALQNFLLKPKANGNKVNLKDVNENNIPIDLINVFSKIDFDKVPEQDLNTYLGVLKQFANKLPQREEA